MEDRQQTRRSQARWQLVYFTLALFDLLTVCGSLFLNHRIMDLYASSVSDNLRWAEKLDAYADLGQWALLTNAPGNDVFDSRDVDAERARFEKNRAEFDARLARLHEDRFVGVESEDRVDLDRRLDLVERAMAEMVAETTRIFEYFEANQPELAGERMATMDRKYAALTTALSDLSAAVRAIQQHRFNQQLAQADELRQAEWGIAFLILLMVCSAIAFGHRVSRQMELAEREREAHTEGVRQAQAAAEHANRAKSRFLATMSHEIRTPLNGVLGMAELLQGTALRNEQKHFVDTIQSCGTHLLEVINSILDFSKLEADRVELERVPVALTALVEDVAAISAERAHGKRLELVYDVVPGVPESVLGDATRIRQVLLNLVSNAVKFTERGEIGIHVWPVRRECTPGHVVVGFAITDTGIGIDDEQRARIFRPFAQADESTTRRFGGTGLGLAIANGLVERMGGELRVESIVGVGSRFSFELELPVAADAEVKSEIQSDLDGLRVLVVDDNATNRTILRRHLASWGANVVDCVDGFSALDLLKRGGERGGFALGVFDLAMPGMDGLMLAENIARDSTIPRFPIVLLTSIDVLDLESEARMKNVVARVNKPCRKAELLRSLRAALGHRPGEAEPAAARPEPLLFDVLLVEDNLVNQQVGSAMLKRLGCRVVVAGTGADALAVAQSGEFDLILMDCELPDTDGLEVTRRLREASALDGASLPPIVALTAHATEEQRQGCLEVGMDDFLSKPLLIDPLRDCIEHHCRRKRVPATSPVDARR